MNQEVESVLVRVSHEPDAASTYDQLGHEEAGSESPEAKSHWKPAAICLP